MSAPRSTILAVDDSEEVRRLLEDSLRQSHVVKTAPDSKAALALAGKPPRPDLVLLDTKLAGQSGYDLCKALRALPGLAEVPVIFLAERRDAQDLTQAFRLDAIDFLVKPFSASTIGADIEARLEQLAHERSAQLKGSERRVARFLRAMEWHDSSLGGKRRRRLAGYVRALAEAAGAREAARDLLVRAAQLHDVGKLGMPAELLRRERTLSGAERELFERHAALGAEIIGEDEDALLKLARTIALTHHERWDGAGYPGRLKANQIPWAGRAMAVVDAFESMTAPPDGGSAISIDRAAAEIGAAAGKQFDPALVEAFRRALPAFRQVHAAHAEQPADDDFVIGQAANGAPRPAVPADDDDFVIGAAAHHAGGPDTPADDDLVIGAAASKALQPAAPADDDPIIGATADPARRPATPKDDDLVIGATASDAPQPAAPANEDLVIGGTAGHARGPAAPADDLLIGAAIFEPTAAEAQKPHPAELPEPTPASQVAAPAHAPAEQAQLQAQIKSLRARVDEVEAERGTTQAALAKAKVELDAARSRVNELETGRSATAAALSQARAQLSDLQRARPEREIAEGQLESLRTRVKELEDELDGARSRVNDLETERSVTAAALSQARAQISDSQRARPQREVAEEQLESLRARVKDLEGELDGARSRVNELETERSAADERHRREQSELQGQLESLRTRVKELEGERGAAQAALAQAKVKLGKEHEAEERHRREQSELREQLESLRTRVKELEGERGTAQAALAQAKLKLGKERETEERHRQERARLEAQIEDLSAEVKKAEAARPAAAPGPTAPPARGSHPVVLLVVFLLGGLAVAVSFVVALYYIQRIG